MGVTFSQNAGVAVSFAGVSLPHHATPECNSELTSPGDAANSASASLRANVQCSKSFNAANTSNTCGTPAAPLNALGQQIQLLLKALSLDWSVADRELDLITLRLAAALLTSRVRVQRGAAHGEESEDAHGPSGSPNPRPLTASYSGDAPMALNSAAAPSTVENNNNNNDDGDAVGPQELYVSSALRLAALQLGRDGLQRIIVALAFLAGRGESREERPLHRNTSLPTTATTSSANPVRRAESSLNEINHFQRGAGYTGSATAATTNGGVGAGTLYHAAGNTFNASGSNLNSLTSSGSAMPGRRFSTVTPLQQQQQQQQPGTANTMVPRSASNASVDHLAHGSPFRGSNAVAGHGYLAPTLRPPNSARSGCGSAIGGADESTSLFNTSIYHRRRSISPFNAALGNATSQLLRARPATELEPVSEEHSYNNVLLTSMNARSTLISPLRTGLHGDLLYSNSSFATLMSLSTGLGGHTSRSHRGDPHFSGGARHSPVSPFFHSITQWVMPPALLGGQATLITGGVMSVNSSMPNSFCSVASPPSAPDPRRRLESYTRRLIQPLSAYQISRLSAVGGGGMGLLSRPASEEANLNALNSRFPQAVGGSGGTIGVDGYHSSYDSAWSRAVVGDVAAGAGAGGSAHPPLFSVLRDTPLQFLRPEAVLTALCSVFAHLQLSTDDVTNLVTLLVVAAVEVQMDAQLRRLVETDEEVAPESLQPPSMRQVRATVTELLAVLLTPVYTRTRLTLCAAAGVMDSDVQAALLSSGVLECTSNHSSGGGNSGPSQQQQQQQQHTPLKSSTRATDFNAGVVPLLPTPSGEHNLSVPPLSFLGTPLRTTTAEGVDAAVKEAELATHVRALHDFFESTIPLESMPSLWSAGGAGAAAPTARAAAVRRLSSAQHSSGSRHQQSPHPTTATTKTAAAVALYTHSSYSESAAGPTSSGSMSRSDITDAVANLMGALPCRGDGGYTAPTQEEVRCASAFLMDVETAFVLHYAEVIQDPETSRRKATTTTSPVPSTPSSPSKRLRQRTGSASKSSALRTPSSPTINASANAAAAAGSTRSTKAYPWRRRSDADPDLFVQLSSNATVWPLRTRLLVRRHEYVYVYDAMASTMALLREENLYSSGEGGAAASSTAAPAAATATVMTDTAAAALSSRVPHPHTPIVLIDLNKATADKNANDLQVLSGPGDVEVVSLMPSRVSRNGFVGGHQRRSSTVNANTASQAGTPNSGSFSNSPLDTPRAAHPCGGSNNGNTNSKAAASRFDDLLNCCWADAYQQDVEVYRMKGSTGTMYLLTVPAEADRVMVPIAAASSPSRTAQDSSNPSSPTATPAEDVVRASVIRSFERNRFVRPAVLSLASSATPAAGAARKESSGGGSGGLRGDNAAGGSGSCASVAGKDPRVQGTYSEGNNEVLSLELGSEPTRIAAYPLRLIYRGVLHHFFFPNPSARDHWYQQLLQLSWMTQSRRYLETVAAAPQNVERFIQNRISFPTGPGAFECLDMLGAGTFGRVLLVQHKLSKRLFAMKVIRKSGFHGIRNIVEARREKKILDQLDCPYIMKIHSSFQTDSRVYLLFDYLPGAELLLHTQSAHSNHFDETTSRFYIAELAIAVEYLRVRGIVHRDIKGDNLVLDAEGHVVLTDFGFAKNITSPPPSVPGAPLHVIRQHTSCGTLAYIAPEVLCNSRHRSGYGLAVDWWSLGVVLFTFLTGYFPFLKQTGPETSQAIVSSPLQFPPRPSLSDDARSLLDQLLQKDPEKRITCLADLRHHRFFEGFDWAACRERRLPPPLVLHKDSYRSPRTTADARQLLQDRVRRSLAWSSGQSEVPYVPPSHSRRSASDKLAAKHQPQLEEEQAELQLVEQAYGSDSMPKPLSCPNDVFGPLFEQQERCGSDRDESDVEDLGMDEYVADLSKPVLEALKRLKESDIQQELCLSTSDVSVNSVCNEHAHVNGAGDDKRDAAAVAAVRVARPTRIVPMPTLPAFVNFSEDLYHDVALAKYNPVAN